MEESDGVPFLTMQLVEELPLDRLICQRGLPVEQILEIAEELADALAAVCDGMGLHEQARNAH